MSLQVSDLGDGNMWSLIQDSRIASTSPTVQAQSAGTARSPPACGAKGTRPRVANKVPKQPRCSRNRPGAGCEALLETWGEPLESSRSCCTDNRNTRPVLSVGPFAPSMLTERDLSATFGSSVRTERTALLGIPLDTLGAGAARVRHLGYVHEVDAAW